MAEQKRGRGRPPKPPEARKRNNVTIRLRDQTKSALERAAEENQRSLSEECESRLEESFRYESLKHDVERLGEETQKTVAGYRTMMEKSTKQARRSLAMLGLLQDIIAEAGPAMREELKDATRRLRKKREGSK